MKIKIKKSDRRILGKPKCHISIVGFKNGSMVTGDMQPEQITDVLTAILHSGDEMAKCIKDALSRYALDLVREKFGQCDCPKCVAARKKVEKMKSEN